MAPRQKKKKVTHSGASRPSTKGKAGQSKQTRHEPKKKVNYDDMDWCAEVKKVKRTYANRKNQKTQKKLVESKPSEIPKITCTSTTYVSSVTTTPYSQTYKEEKHANVVAWVNSNPYARSRTPSPTPPPPSRPNALTDSMSRGFALYKLAKIIQILEAQLVEAEKERKLLAKHRPRTVRGRCCV